MTTLASRFLAVPFWCLRALLPAPMPQEPNPNRNVRFGLPGWAKSDPASRDDYLIARPQYVLSYNASLDSHRGVIDLPKSPRPSPSAAVFAGSAAQ